MFRDRQDAGRRLAARLDHFRDEHPLVLGLPRGGVVVAAEVARALDAPLDVLIVRKLGAPHQPELAIGAVTDGAHPQTILNQELVDGLAVSEAYLQREISEQMAEVQRRQEFYRRGRPAPAIAHRMVIVIDDGIATGATMRAGLAALRAARPRRLVLAVPVAPPEVLQALAAEVDDEICLHSPPNFMAVGRFYSDFEQTSDEEVIALLDEAAPRVAIQG
jgi:putative phosphoribosyl transferase